MSDDKYAGYHAPLIGGSVEVFHSEDFLDEGQEPGWYWWSCFPGCLPDGEATGPFATSKEAYDDAMVDD